MEFLRISSSAIFTSDLVGEHLVLALFVGCLTGSLGLDHLLFGFGQIGLGFAEVVLLLGGIELRPRRRRA